ncbi:MAG: serine/threonine protein phosphatase [Bacteroidetes bacterium]|nr:serine/threonine protein phosphatase [Bacteroidota bacterium]
MKTWVIPDIHGCLQTLRYVVEDMIQLEKRDKLFILGDIIDRGPDSKGVIDYIMQLESQHYNVLTLRGNHEDFMLKVIEAEKNNKFWKGFRGAGKLRKEWFRFGGEATLKSFGEKKISNIPDIYVNWLKALPFYSQYGKFLIVHAGFNFKNDNIFEDENAMLWTRDYEIDPDKLAGRRIIHGHVPVDLEFIYSCLKINNVYNFIALDNGVYMTDRPGYGNLTALELNTMDLKIQPNLDQQP